MSRESVPISSLRKLEQPAGYPNGRVHQPDAPVPSQAADPAGASLARKIRQQLPLRELFAAVAMDSLEGARRAIGQGADPNAIVGVEQRFPLASAVLANQSAMVRLLLRAGADPSQRDAAGRTPLIMSASVGSAEIAKALLACGTAVDAYDHQGTTALMEAARNRHGELVRLLIRHGALPDRQDRNGQTALMMAAAVADHESIDCLVRAGADPELRDCAGETALDRACRQNRHAALATLVCFGSRNGSGHALRHQPPARSGPSTADITTNDGQTALMLAAKNGDLLIMDLLIRSGVQIDKQDARGETALMKAAYHGQTMAVDMLLARGADASITSKNGDTARVLAKKGAESVRHAQVAASLQAAADRRASPG